MTDADYRRIAGRVPAHISAWHQVAAEKEQHIAELERRLERALAELDYTERLLLLAIRDRAVLRRLAWRLLRDRRHIARLDREQGR